MKFNKIFAGLLCLSVLQFSCAKKDLDEKIVKYVYKQYHSNLSDFVKCICFTSIKTGYIASNGYIFKTTDAGAHWTSDSLTDKTINSIFFVDNETGYAVGGNLKASGSSAPAPGSVIYKTVNGGTSWVKQTVPYKDSELNSVYFVNENIGFAMGLGLHVKTTDGGATWHEFVLDYVGIVNKVYFVNSQTGFAVGSNGVIFRTEDQGVNWSLMSNQSQGHIADICFVNDQVGFASGQGGVVKTVDGGRNWMELTFSPLQVFVIHFADAFKGIAIGLGHYVPEMQAWTTAIHYTEDGGVNWITEDNVAFVPIAHFPTLKTGFSVMTGSTVQIDIK